MVFFFKNPDKTATVTLVEASASGVTGTVRFVQHEQGGPVSVFGTIYGLAPGLHGFHVHANGVLTSECVDAGGHFNPDGVSKQFDKVSTVMNML